MRFSFLHTADLHLDSPMRGLSARRPELATLFADATRRAFTGLVDTALELKVAFVLIAGDIYDGDWKDHSTGLFFTGQVARLSRAGIPVFMIRGNHDAESQISRSLVLPDGVHLFGTRKAETQDLPDLRVAIHGRSFADQAVAENMARTYPAARPGWFNIGLLHTSLDGREDHAPYAPCTVEDLALKGYDYWALGHVHAREIVARDPWVVFPGNVQGRHVRETGARGAVLVTVEDGHVDTVGELTLDVARWARLTVDATQATTVEDLVAGAEAALRSLAEAGGERPVVARLRFSGETPAHRAVLTDREGFEAELANAAGRVGEAVHVEKIELATREPRRGGEPAVSGLVDPAGLIDRAMADAGFAGALRESVQDILGKLPDEIRDMFAAPADGPGVDDMLLAEARDLALGRLTRGEPA